MHSNKHNLGHKYVGCNMNLTRRIWYVSVNS